MGTGRPSVQRYYQAVCNRGRLGYGFALRALFATRPCTVWHWPAFLPATLWACVGVTMRPIAGPALRALGQSETWPARWRYRWSTYHQRELDALLSLQQSRTDAAWLARHITIAPGCKIPDGGAVLVALHHANMRLLVSFCAKVLGWRLGGVVFAPFATWKYYTGPPESLLADAYGDDASVPGLALGHGLRVLRAGGYFIVPLDVINGPWTCQPLLGKALPLARGALWLAARSGCFIVPVALVPRRRGHWDAWFGAPIEPTLASLARAREDCLRRAPATWELREWKAWHAAPLAPSTVASR